MFGGHFRFCCVITAAKLPGFRPRFEPGVQRCCTDPNSLIIKLLCKKCSVDISLEVARIIRILVKFRDSNPDPDGTSNYLIINELCKKCSVDIFLV
jgi:hypothetical protein